MTYASVTYTSASGTTFALTNGSGDPIPYLRQSDIQVTVNGVLKTLTTDYTFNSAGTAIVLNSPVTSATVTLTRVTDIGDATVVYTPGSTLTAQDLNNADNQIRYGLQEFSDTYGALTSGTGDLSLLGGFIGSGEAWLSDNSHAATTAAIDSRVDGKIDTALTTDIVAGTDISISDNTPGSGQITIAHNVTGANTTVNNSDGTVIQDITVTAQGHVTSVGSYDLDNRYYTKTQTDGAYVALTGAQTVAGVKTFSSSPVVPTPTNATDAANKSYVDGVASSGVSDGDKGDIIVGSAGTSWTIDSGVVTNSKIAAGTITDSAISASAAITGTKIQQGSTSVRGTVQLTDSVSDNSTTTAATPNSVKTAYDLANTANTTANAAFPAAGGVITGDVILDNQRDIRFREATANGTNYVGFQAPSSIASDVLWTLPATDAAVSGYALKSDGAGNLSWGLAGGALGGGTDQVFYENDQVITTNYTITSGKNAMTTGPVTINSGVTVTVPSGSSWVII
jgi:hypothetical protein